MHEIKFIHTSDLHLGRKYKYLGEVAHKAQSHLIDIMMKIASIAIEKKVDFVFISGDLFDNETPSSFLIAKFMDFVDLLSAKNIQIVILPGTHDSSLGNSLYSKHSVFTENKNVFVFIDKVTNKFIFQDKSIAVYGNCYPGKSSPILGFQRDSSVNYHVILAHGSLQIEGKSDKNDSPILISDIDSSFADYIALGHWHNYYSIKSNVPCFYSGSPELIDKDQINSGYIIYGCLGNNSKFEPIHVGERRFDDIKIDISNVTKITELIQKIKKGSDENLIRRIDLWGTKKGELIGFNFSKLKEELLSLFYYLIIEDHSSFILSTNSFSKNFSSIEKIYYERLSNLIKNASSQEDKEKYSRALEMGIALLSGNEDVI